MVFTDREGTSPSARGSTAGLFPQPTGTHSNLHQRFSEDLCESLMKDITVAIHLLRSQNRGRGRGRGRGRFRVWVRELDPQPQTFL